MSQLAIRAALELAFQAIGAAIPSVSIVSSAGGLFTTSAPHGLVSGIDVKISGHTSLSVGRFTVSVLGPTTFKVLNKVTQQTVVISNGTGGSVTAQLTAWDNVSFNPVGGIPYEKVNYVFSKPDNITMGAAFYRERGYMQITLCYPEKTGSFAAMSRAELIRNAYPRGASFSNNGIIVKIDLTAEILTGGIVDQTFIIYVRVPFYADIYS